MATSFFRNEAGADITVKISEDTEIPAHSIILCLWSEKWRTILSPDHEGGKMKELETKTIDVSGQPDVLLFLEAIYSLPDGVLVEDETVFRLFRVAHEHRCQSIMRKCAHHVNYLINTAADPVLPTWVLNEWTVFASKTRDGEIVHDAMCAAANFIKKDVVDLHIDALEYVVEHLCNQPYDALKKITAWILAKNTPLLSPTELTKEQTTACDALDLINWPHLDADIATSTYLELLRNPKVPRKYLSKLRHIFFEVTLANIATPPDKSLIFDRMRKRKRKRGQ